MSDELLQQYSTTLEHLATSPFNRELHVQRIQLAKELGLADEVENGRIDWADHFPLSEGEFSNSVSTRHRRQAYSSGTLTAEWNEWIDNKKSLLPSATPVEDVEPYMNVIELYRRANRDYLCELRISLLVSLPL